MPRTPPRPGSRRASAEATRARLLDAGREAFARKGLAATNLTQDILEPAEVSVGSFYHQFRDKTDLLVAIVEDHADSLRARLREVHRPAPGRSLVEIARQSYALTFEMAEQHLDATRILLRERDLDDPRIVRFVETERRRWIESLMEDYQRLAEANRIALDVELAAEMISLLTAGALARYLELPPRERPAARERLLDGLVRFTLGGLPGLTLAEPTAGHSSQSPMDRRRAAANGAK
jgi:AcrR family transcriptional regulator